MIKYPITAILVLALASCSENKSTPAPTPVPRDLSVTSISLPNGGPDQFLIANLTSPIEITVRNNDDSPTPPGWQLGYDDFSLLIDEELPALSSRTFTVQFTPLESNVPNGYLLVSIADWENNTDVFARRFGFISGPIPIPLSNN